MRLINKNSFIHPLSLRYDLPSLARTQRESAIEGARHNQTRRLARRIRNIQKQRTMQRAPTAQIKGPVRARRQIRKLRKQSRERTSGIRQINASAREFPEFLMRDSCRDGEYFFLVRSQRGEFDFGGCALVPGFRE